LNNLYLTGMEGCGKTCVGRELARMAGIPFVDINCEIEREAGMPLADILSKEGLEGLRERAKAALEAAAKGDWQIVACYAEAPLFPDALESMQRTGAVVFLDTPLDRIVDRFDFSRYRGLIDREDALRAPYEKRHGAYVSSCGVQFDYSHAEAVDAAYDLLQVFYPDYFWR
jgi:shikimate kinase